MQREGMHIEALKQLRADHLAPAECADDAAEASSARVTTGAAPHGGVTAEPRASSSRAQTTAPAEGEAAKAAASALQMFNNAFTIHAQMTDEKIKGIPDFLPENWLILEP